jgi:hypothetical protein
MSETYVGDPNAPWEDDTIPDDGDDEDAASVDVALQSHADKLAYLKALRHESSSVYRVLNAHPWTNTPGNWEVERYPSDPLGWKQLAFVDNDRTLVFPFNLPHGCTLYNLFVRIKPVVHVSVPTVPPGWNLIEIDRATGAPTVVASMTDAPANVAAYNAAHDLAKVSGLSAVIDRDAKRYQLEVFGESSSGSFGAVGLVVVSIRARFSMTHLEEAPAS